MNPDELYSADPEKLLKRAISDVRFARSGFEAGHTTKALLLAIRGIEKMLLFHLMERDIPHSRNSTSLRELLRYLVNTPIHTEDREQLCSRLDAFQFEQEDKVMDIIQSGKQYKTLDELDDQDVENAASSEFGDREDEDTLEDWDNDEWGPEGWSKGGEVDVEGFEMDDFEPSPEETEEHSAAGNSSGTDGEGSVDTDDLPSFEELPDVEEMYQNALSLFKELSRMVDGNE